MGEIHATRAFNLLFVILDISWNLILIGILLYGQRFKAVVFGLLGGILYFIVDYGGFFQLAHTRQVTGGDPFWVLLWMSMSYGFTNFVIIWVWLDRDEHALEWSLLVVCGWFAVAFLSQNFGQALPMIGTTRGTNSYHGIMAFVMLAGYLVLVLRNLRRSRLTEAQRYEKAPLLRLLAVGIGVQFGWEAVLLLAGIRPQGIDALVVNSLIETNLGMPWLYLIHKAVTRPR